MIQKLLVASVTFVICIITFIVCDVETDMKYIKICNMTSPITLETMNQVLINKKIDQGRSNNFKCFLYCLFTKYKWMDEDGGFFLHEMRRVLDETNIDAALLEYIIFKCTAIDSVDKCERAMLFTQCFWDKAITEQTAEEDLLFYELMEKK